MRILISFIFIVSFFATKAQKVEKIFVNLYTDSLKKGTYNYINIDGELSNGRYVPLDSNKIIFTCTEAVFYGNTLFIPADCKLNKVTIRVALKENLAETREFDMYIKRAEDPPLRSEAEVLEEMRRKKKGGRA